MEERHNLPACHMVSKASADEPHAEVHLWCMGHATYLLKLQKKPRFEKGFEAFRDKRTAAADTARNSRQSCVNRGTNW